MVLATVDLQINTVTEASVTTECLTDSTTYYSAEMKQLNIGNILIHPRSVL